MTRYVTAAVEGLLEDAVARRLITNAGGEVGSVYGRLGRESLLKRLTGYARAAEHSPWLVLLDLERDPCAPLLLRTCLPSPGRLMVARVAVRSTEAWLMADRRRLAATLAVRDADIPVDPERLASPKRDMVNLARRSRRRDVVREMVPEPGLRHPTGPGYTGRLIAFVEDEAAGWRPGVAALSAPSLAKTILRLEALVAAGGLA